MAKNNTTANVSYEFTFNIIPLMIVVIMGAASNVLLLVAFIKDPLKCFRNSGTYLVMNLSVSDCLACLFLPFYLATMVELLKTDPQLIEFLEFWTFWVVASSFLSITSISIDRFLMVTYPIKHRILIKGKFVILWLAFIWIVSCLVSVFSQVYISLNDRKITHVFSVIVIVLSAVFYSSTYYKLKKQSRNLSLMNSNESRSQEIRILKEQRFLKTIIIIACVSVGCVVPSLVFYLNYNSLSLPSDNLTSKVIGTATLFILYMNFTVNPLIYILRLPNYRKTFFLLYCRRKTTSN